MTARLAKDAHTRLSPEGKREAYKNRFRPGQALPSNYELGRPVRPPPRMLGGAAVLAMDPKDIQPRDLVDYARENSLPVLQRLYEIAMMESDGAKELAVSVEAACQFLNRAGLYEIKGQVAVIHAQVHARMQKQEVADREAKTVEVEALTEGLGPKGPML